MKLDENKIRSSVEFALTLLWPRKNAQAIHWRDISHNIHGIRMVLMMNVNDKKMKDELEELETDLSFLLDMCWSIYLKEALHERQSELNVIFGCPES